MRLITTGDRGGEKIQAREFLHKMFGPRFICKQRRQQLKNAIYYDE